MGGEVEKASVVDFCKKIGWEGGRRVGWRRVVGIGIKIVFVNINGKDLLDKEVNDIGKRR